MIDYEQLKSQAIKAVGLAAVSVHPATALENVGKTMLYHVGSGCALLQTCADPSSLMSSLPSLLKDIGYVTDTGGPAYDKTFANTFYAKEADGGSDIMAGIVIIKTKKMTQVASDIRVHLVRQDVYTFMRLGNHPQCRDLFNTACNDLNYIRLTDDVINQVNSCDNEKFKLQLENIREALRTNEALPMTQVLVKMGVLKEGGNV